MMDEPLLPQPGAIQGGFQQMQIQPEMQKETIDDSIVDSDASGSCDIDINDSNSMDEDTKYQEHKRLSENTMRISNVSMNLMENDLAARSVLGIES